MEELEVVRQELEGALTPEMAAELRNKMKEEMKAKEEAERKKKDEESIKPIVVTLNNFKQEVADAPVPVVIDFWAEWCGPCKQIAPIIDQLSKELAGKVKFVKVNVDEQQEIAYQFQIQSIPTLMIFYRKQPVDMIVGAVDKRSLTARLQRVLDAVAQLEEREKAAGGNVLTESESSAPPAPPTQPKTRPDIVTPQFNVRRTPRQRQ
jgi:thioredoxin 1